MALAAGAAGVAGAAAPSMGEAQRGEDLEALREAVARGYAYLGNAGAWNRACEAARPRVRAAEGRAKFVGVLEAILATLHDDHIWMSEHAPDSPRRVPAETDIWASWQRGAAVIEAVRTYGDADVAGLRPGQVVRSISGIPAPDAVRRWAGHAASGPETRDWALRHALAGPREGLLRIEVAGDRTYEVERRMHPSRATHAFSTRRIGERRDLGYLRLKAPLSSSDLAGAFEAAMRQLGSTRAFILDLREATGPVDDPTHARGMIEAILARFATRPGPWQLRQGRDGKRIADKVEPAKDTYTSPLVVLVDRWTAGEGEALAAGLHAVAGARLIGTRMAGLRGELGSIRLPHSGIEVGFPRFKVLQPDGTPRESLRPDILVDLAAPQAGPGDPILYQALKLLEA